MAGLRGYPTWRAAADPASQRGRVGRPTGRKRGLVHSALGEDDRREVYVQLTPRGESILRALTLHHKNELRLAAPALVATLQTVARMKPCGRSSPDGTHKGKENDQPVARERTGSA